jgi:tetratricopeptide (TPR) repeat protein
MFVLSGCGGADWSREVADAADLIRQHRNHLVTAEQAAADGNEALAQERSILANVALQDAARIVEGMPLDRMTDPSALSVFAEAQALAGQADLVVEALERLAALEPDNTDHPYRLALVLAEMGPSYGEQALRVIHQATRLDDLPEPRMARVYDAYGRVAHEAGLFDLAAEAYNEALSLDEDLDWPRLGAALLLIEDGSVHEAAVAIDAFGTIPPDLGIVFSRLLRDALRRLDTGGLQLPDHPEYHLAYARLLVRDGRVGDALLPLRRSTKQDGSSIVAWNMLGSLAANMGETALAREAFEQSLAVEPNQPRTRQSLESLGQS